MSIILKQPLRLCAHACKSKLLTSKHASLWHEWREDNTGPTFKFGRAIASHGSLLPALARPVQRCIQDVDVKIVRGSTAPHWAGVGTVEGIDSTAYSLRERVVIYDGVCHLCNAGVNWVIKVDREKLISFCAVQSKAAEPYLVASGLSREDVLQRFLYFGSMGEFFQGSTAALRMAACLPPPLSALSVLLVIPEPIRDLLYDYVAQRRYKWFGRSDTCLVPRGDVLDRFLDRDELTRLKEEEEEERSGEGHGWEKRSGKAGLDSPGGKVDLSHRRP